MEGENFFPDLYTYPVNNIPQDSLYGPSTSFQDLDFDPADDRSVLRSCLTCHRRKIRCDKQWPCSSCARINVLCSYPEVEQTRRRQPRTSVRELSARLARLERTISVLTKENSTNTPPLTRSAQTGPSAAAPAPATPSQTMSSQVPTSASSPEELLVKDGTTSRYINENILSRILDGERELQFLMSNSSFDAETPAKVCSSDLTGIFHDFNQNMNDMQSCHPRKWQALQLWQIFLSNVDPVIKVLHIPTTQAAIYTVISNPGSGEADLNSLLFAIYFSATASLSTGDASYMLGQDKRWSLRQFKRGLEHSLACANVFDSPTLRSLQAMTLYVTCLRTFTTGRSGWTLTGLTIRLAQSIGFHRDGTNLGLSPFDSELRRRVWWYLFVADSRTAEDLGFTVCNVDRSTDTHLPLNINDSDLSPDMPELPKSKATWTEMTFGLIKIELGQIYQRIIYRPAIPPDNSLDALSKAQILDDLKASLQDKYLQYWDQNIPIHRVSSLLTPIILAKLDFLLKQQTTHSHSAREIVSDNDQDALVAACQLLENFLQLTTDEFLRGFHWYLGSYTQYHLLTFLLSNLCLKPDGLNAERMWGILERSFQLAEHRQLTAESESKWTVLRLLRDKALLIRERYFAVVEINVPGLGESLNEANPTSELREVPEYDFVGS